MENLLSLDFFRDKTMLLENMLTYESMIIDNKVA